MSAASGVTLDELLAARPNPAVPHRHPRVDVTAPSPTTPSGRTRRTGPIESAVLEVVRQVDEHWPTIADRSARALAGLSMGGYGALNIGLHHLGTFGTIESWSGYFTQTRSGAFSGAPRRRSASTARPPTRRRSQPALQRLPLHVFLYTGRAGPADPRPARRSPRSCGAWGRRSAPRSRPGVHDWRLWRAQMPRRPSLSPGTGSTGPGPPPSPRLTAPAGSADSARRVWAGRQAPGGDADPDERGQVDEADRRAPSRANRRRR